MSNELKKFKVGCVLKKAKVNLVLKKVERKVSTNVNKRNQLRGTQTGGPDSKHFYEEVQIFNMNMQNVA